MRALPLYVRIAIECLVTAALCCAVWWAVTRPTKPVSPLESAYDGLTTALRKKDLPGYMAWLAPDYTESRFDSRPWTRAEAEGHYRRTMDAWTAFEQVDWDTDNIRIQGKNLQVVCDQAISGRYHDAAGIYGTPGRDHDLRFKTTCVDDWINTPAGWRMRKRHMTSAAVWVDGKLLPGRKP